MHSFRRRILLLVVGLVIVTQSVTLFAVLARTSTAVEERAAERLAFGGRTVEQLIGFRNVQLASAVTVLSADFGFREAIASGDRPTILSAIENQRDRIDAGFVAVFDPEGRVVASTAPQFARLRDALPRMRGEQDGTPQPHALVIGDRAWQLFVAPVLAPEAIAWVAMGFALDESFARSIRELAGVEVSLLAARDGVSDAVVASTLSAEARVALEALARSPGRLAVGGTRPDALGDARWLTFAQRLDPESADTLVALHQSEDEALAPYYDLRNTVAAVGGTALLVAMLVGLRLGRLATRPLGALMGAARRIENGDYADIEVRGGDEFAHLATTMNTMQRGIADRERRLSHAAFHDALTGLPNLALAQRHIESLLAARRGAVAIVVIETAGLRDVSATFGHALADRTVTEIARRLEQNVRSDDLVARIANDRFLAITADGQVKPAMAMAAQLCTLLRGGLEVDGLNLVFDAIAGVAIAPDHGDNAAELLSRAEVALNDCREAARSVMLYVPGRDARVRRRLELGALLRDAIATGEGLYLAFQPKVHVDDGTMAGVETLARWRHPALGEISPGEFAPLAEQIGAIRDLTRWVAREAIRQLGEWRRQGLGFDVAINISAADILDLDLGDELLAQLRRHDVPPTALVLEITESALVDDAAAAARNIEMLQAMGVRFAIDDFGTGHSSLSLLQTLPFDELKIDRSFLAHAHESADDRKIVASTIELAHGIGMKVVAEGVELEASMQLLRELGCDVAQGYLVSRPIAAADVPGFCVRTGIPIPSAGCHTPPSASIAASS